MIIAVINFSGNVGKSTIARHMLAPRLEDSEIIPIETINSDGTEEEAFKGKEFGQLMDSLALSSNAIVDIGASNVEDFIGLMKQYRGSHEDFDLFLIPTVPKTKQQRDTIATIEALSNIGVQAQKIHVIFNMLETDEILEKSFIGLFEYQKTHKNFTINPEATVYSNELYSKIQGGQQTIKTILNDATDYKLKIKTTDNTDEKLHYAQQLSLKRLALGVSEELDRSFNSLLKQAC